MHSDSRFSQAKSSGSCGSGSTTISRFGAVPTICMVPYVMYGTVSDTIYFIWTEGLYLFQYKIKKFLCGWKVEAPNRVRICKPLDKESIPSLAESIPRNRYMDSLNIYKDGLWYGSLPRPPPRRLCRPPPSPSHSWTSGSPQSAPAGQRNSLEQSNNTATKQFNGSPDQHWFWSAGSGSAFPMRIRI